MISSDEYFNFPDSNFANYPQDPEYDLESILNGDADQARLEGRVSSSYDVNNCEDYQYFADEEAWFSAEEIPPGLKKQSKRIYKNSAFNLWFCLSCRHLFVAFMSNYLKIVLFILLTGGLRVLFGWFRNHGFCQGVIMLKRFMWKKSFVPTFVKMYFITS